MNQQNAWNLNEAFGEAEPEIKQVEDPTNYRPFSDEAKPTAALNPQSGLLVKRDERGRIVSQTQTRDVFGARRPGAEPVTRLKPVEPRQADELTDELHHLRETLTRQIDYFRSVEGTNPLAERIVATKLEIARLQALLAPLQTELAELLATPIPSDLIVQQLEAAQTRTQQLSREATERKLRSVIEEDLDLRFKDATNDDKRNILKTRKMAATKSIIARFWPKPITLDGLATHSNRIFSAIEQTINFLKS